MSTTNRPGSRKIAKKLGLSALFLIATSLFFLGDHLNPGRDRIFATAISAALLLGLTILFYRSERFHRYWEVTFAFFSGSFGLFLAWNIPDSPLSVFGASLDTPQGVAVLKFFELLPVALVIIVLTRIVQGSLSPIYIQKGKLRSGLGLGLLLGFVILVIYFALTWSTIDPAKAIPALPWLIIFAVSNAFFEELLIRGLFLKRYIALLGTTWAVVLSALCYGLFFIGVQSAVGPIPYGALIVIFPLGLLYGFIMQRSDSIWGPVSIHAVIDLIFLFGIFAPY
ncbi:MAG: CPBP family intramembrane metalloprotease [Anaerolineales bacterium]|nr:CPBP family intramembrane metalloprotease [Anaerolineales bacterium]